MSYLEEFVENLSQEQLDEVEQKIKEKKAYGKPEKAYAKPFGTDFIEAVLKLLKKAGIKLSDEDQSKLEAMVGKSGELTVSKTGEVFSVLPQGEGGGLTKLKVLPATGELYREGTKEETEQFIKEFMTYGVEHQKEYAQTKRKLERTIAEATGEKLEEEE